LLADEGEAGPQLDQELLDMREQPFLEGVFLSFFGEREELEVVGVFEDLAGEVGFGGGEAPDEVGGGLALAPVEVALDPVYEDGAAPAVLDGLADVPFTFDPVFHVVEQADAVAPRNLWNLCRVRHKFHGRAFPVGQGLYWQPTEMPGLSLEDRDDFEVLPWPSGYPPAQQFVVGLHLWFFRFHLALLVANAPPRSVAGHHQPAGLRVGGCNKRIVFNWIDGPQYPEITLGR
jgi:hypothetical protein